MLNKFSIKQALKRIYIFIQIYARVCILSKSLTLPYGWALNEKAMKHTVFTSQPQHCGSLSFAIAVYLYREEEREGEPAWSFHSLHKK
jgi:hypothetical protein